MNGSAAKALAGAMALSFFLAPVVAGADAERELKGIKKRIERERQGITEVKKKEISILGTLEEIERRLDKGNERLNGINLKLEAILLDLQKKEKEAASVNTSLRARRELLKKRAQALYMWQRGGSPFILLNGAVSVADLMRRKRYLGAMLSKDQQLLNGLVKELARQESLKRALARRREDLDRERTALVKVKESIRLEREKKREILGRLRREKEMRARVLTELEQAAKRLEKMIDEVSRRSTGRSSGVFSGGGFAAFKGKLDYPVRGKVVGGFGKTRHPEFPDELFRKGIDIKAPLGEEIKAVGAGRVIFANRFGGYGKMIVIDHGERYYTVYAHLSRLLKRSGARVQRGEPIALVGDTDSLGGSRLHFEIRKGGKPLDPLAWFRRE